MVDSLRTTFSNNFFYENCSINLIQISRKFIPNGTIKTNKHWFGWWLKAPYVRQMITWTNANQLACSRTYIRHSTLRSFDTFPVGCKHGDESIWHYSNVIMSMMVSQITSLTIVYSTVYSGADQRKHQSSTSLAVVRGIHQWPVNSPHKWPVTRKMFPFDDVIMGHKLLRDQHFSNISPSSNLSLSDTDTDTDT